MSWRACVMIAVLAASCACSAHQKASPRPASRRVAMRPVAVSRDFYRAVSAYVEGDYRHAHACLDRILKLSPEDREALALRRRVRLAERLSSP